MKCSKLAFTMAMVIVLMFLTNADARWYEEPIGPIMHCVRQCYSTCPPGSNDDPCHKACYRSCFGLGPPAQQWPAEPDEWWNDAFYIKIILSINTSMYSCWSDHLLIYMLYVSFRIMIFFCTIYCYNGTVVHNNNLDIKKEIYTIISHLI